MKGYRKNKGGAAYLNKTLAPLKRGKNSLQPKTYVNFNITIAKGMVNSLNRILARLRPMPKMAVCQIRAISVDTAAKTLP